MLMSTTASIVPCPACSQHVALADINAHLDSACRSFSNAAADSSDRSSSGSNDLPTSPVSSRADAVLGKRKDMPALLLPPRQRRRSLPSAASVLTDVRPTKRSNSLEQQQASLHTFFGGHDPTILPYFHLHYDADADNGARWSASFYASLQDMPPDTVTNWSASTYIRPLRKSITVSTNLAPTSSPPPALSPASTPSPPTRWTNIALLKSHLQKCVRRQLPELAIATAYELSQLSFTDLVRRIGIIPIEDAHFVTAFPLIVWCMLADSKGYTVPVPLLHELLGLIGAIAKTTVRDVEPLAPATKGAADSIRVQDIIQRIERQTQLPRKVKDALWSICIRRAFGGMTGDMEMLDRMLQVLYGRCVQLQGKQEQLDGLWDALTLAYTPATCSSSPFAIETTSKASPPPPSQSFVSAHSLLVAGNKQQRLELVPPLTVESFLPAAADHHVCPVLQQLQALPHGRWRADVVEERTLKRVIWNCSSAVNARTCAAGIDPTSGAWLPHTNAPEVDSSDVQMWEDQLSRDFEHLAKEFIRARH
ncbi:hypothetical protein RI367_005175 [Sorochytrium milnesiophthora]